jgi:hypothetical protein
VDDVPGGQSVPAGKLCMPGRAAVQLLALRQQSWPGGAMDRTVNSATAEQRLIRRVHDGIGRHPRDIPFNYSYSVANVHLISR